MKVYIDPPLLECQQGSLAYLLSAIEIRKLCSHAKTQALISERTSVGLDASVAPAVASVAGLGASASYPRDYQVKIKGVPWCSSSHSREVENMVMCGGNPVRG